MLQDIFNALASDASQGGAQSQAGNQPQAGGDLLSGLLGSLISGGTSGQAAGQSQAGGDLVSGLLGSFMGGQSGGGMPAGAGQMPNQPQAGGDLVSSLLGSFMAGQTGGAMPAGGGQVGSNPMMNLVSSGQKPMVNSLIQPAASTISQKLGVSPEIGMMVVTFAVHYMLSNHGTKLVNGEDISGVLQQHTNQNYLKSAGISKELANQTGLKPQAAANALSEVFKLFGAGSRSN
jgi:hypothetical protein